MTDALFTTDNATNNGSYTWYNNWAGTAQPSGCNYSIQLDIGSQQAYSDYFILRDQDDRTPINRTLCPASETPCGPGEQLCDLSAGGTTRTGITTTTLAIAAVVPIVVLLILFALIVCIGTRKGWFMPKGHNGTCLHDRRRGNEPAQNVPHL
ncbi:unnamed protein product [Zymoseptoria tritici ST99CH_3D7]|uniref:Uncharacterized protein n=1 Tax=Zymoseptoria tritici (strain ST99CH_3D7) TaxID=1276538 RepID=A0A1X7RVW5_ZYMT9|nr:unnamed protein product [Zymoseptoria tritici ST99CH_3D7]